MLAVRAERFALHVLHEPAVDQGIKKTAPVLLVKLLLYVGAGDKTVELAREFAPSVLRALGL